MTVDDAVRAARGVVGFYGDPLVSWSIGLDVDLERPVSADTCRDRGRSLAENHPHLGRLPSVEVFEDTASGDATVRRFLDTEYGDRDPLIRIAVDGGGGRLVVAAHHGAVDGFGLLSVIAALSAAELTTRARGLGRTAPRHGFVRSSVMRLAEAVATPPHRLVGESGAGPGDVTADWSAPLLKVDTARVAYAATHALTVWNAARHGRADRVVVAVGASRRGGATLLPDRDTAYLRVKVTTPVTVEFIGDALASTPPEPSFPESGSRRLAEVLTRALRSRLGSSVLVSNLGLVDSAGAVRRIRFYPVAAGPRAFSVGVASTPEATCVTVRLPARDFSAAAAHVICDLVARRLAAAAAADP